MKIIPPDQTAVANLKPWIDRVVQAIESLGFRGLMISDESRVSDFHIGSSKKLKEAFLNKLMGKLDLTIAPNERLIEIAARLAARELEHKG